jgi:hypothetical protein
MAGAPATPPSDDLTEQDPPFSPVVVEETIRALVKATRAHQLYLRNNPMHARALDACRAAFAPVWELTEEITLAVTETDLRWYAQQVLSEPEKASDSLPWILYKDGIREIQLMRGFEDTELVLLLDIIQRVRRASPDEDDLITLLWEQDFSCLRYKYVELALDALAGIVSTPFEQRKVEVEDTATAAVVSSAPGIISMSDFDSTLYFLDAGEISYLNAEVAKEYQNDLRTNVAAMLLDIFEWQVEKHVRDEIVELLDYYLIHLVASHSFSATAYLLRECEAAAGRARSLNPVHKERLQRLPARLSEREALLEMLRALDDSPELPPQKDLEELFTELRGTTLEILLGWLGSSQNAALRPLLEGAAGRLASSNTAELIRLINVEDKQVRIEAMRRAGALRTTAAVTPLARSVGDADDDIRLAAVMALSGIGSPGAMQALDRSVEDRVRDVRIAAVRALASQTFRPALQRVEGAIKGRQIRDADLTEKMAFYEAYGALAGEAGIQFLDGVLNGKGLFGKKEDSEIRACAAMALGRIGSDRALSSLQKASGEKDVIVRNAINRAFRGSTT